MPAFLVAIALAAGDPKAAMEALARVTLLDPELQTPAVILVAEANVLKGHGPTLDLAEVLRQYGSIEAHPDCTTSIVISLSTRRRQMFGLYPIHECPAGRHADAGEIITDVQDIETGDEDAQGTVFH